MGVPEKRKRRRLKAKVPVHVEQLGLTKLFCETVSVDISTTGLKVKMDAFCPPKSQLLIKLQFPEVNKSIEAIAKVIWSQRITYSDRYETGLRFFEINPIFKKWIEEYIQINEAYLK